MSSDPKCQGPPSELPPSGVEGARVPAVLPAAEGGRGGREVWGSGVSLVAIAAVILIERELSTLRALPASSSLLFLLLNAVNVILVLLLLYLIARNLVKLIFERRKGILGAHLHLKFVLALFLVATIPTVVVFFVAYIFVTSSLQTWFSLRVDGAMERAREVADAYYDAWTAKALHFGEIVSEEIRAEGMLRQGHVAELQAFVQRKQREYDLGVVQVFPYAEEEPLVTSVNPEIPDAAFVQRESPIVAAALAGEQASLVEGTGSDVGDVVRGAVPIYSSDPARPKEVVGALVVNTLVPHALAAKIEEIRVAADQYRAVQPYAGHLAWVYQIELLLCSLVILLFALWWGFRMARGVTHSIRALAEGTAEVARGNLDVELEPQSDDEVGFLVRSFNRMTRDLREARRSLETSAAELDQRRRYMETVLRNVGAGVVSLDADGRIGTINPPAQRFLGIPPGTAAVGHKLDEVVTRPEYLDVVAELSAQTRAGVRESVRKQVQIPSGDEVLTLLVTLTLLQDDDGRPLGTVVVFDDYTQEVRAQRMAAWREVARRIAHEIKNPLTPIQLSAQRIRRRLAGRLEEGDRRVLDECVETIGSQVEGLKVLVNEFSNFARLPAARPRPGDLNRLVGEAVAGYAGTDEIDLRTELDPSLPTVEFDTDQMRRVLTNMVDNAISAIRERAAAEGGPVKGSVVLRTLHDAPLGTARIEIEDDGLGIRAEDRRRIFEPYFSTKAHGTGLGLAIVSRIVADHRGYVRVHPNRPRGTRFIVELPVRSV
jgi:two-component system, NtrC family, nitrogen regulation sensor histidine kinase NtrY